MKYNTLIFDFDFTLIDASVGIIECFKYGFEKLGLKEPDEKAIVRTIGLTLVEAFDNLTETVNNPDGEKFRKLFVEKADEVMVSKTVFINDAFEVLSFLKGNGIKVGIVTTKYRYRTKATLEFLKSEHLVDIIIGGEDVKIAKPDPEGLKMAISQLDAQKEKVLYIGDSYVDAKTAMNAGVDFCAVTTGTTTKEDFEAFPHEYIAKSLTDMKNHFFGG